MNDLAMDLLAQCYKIADLLKDLQRSNQQMQENMERMSINLEKLKDQMEEEDEELEVEEDEECKGREESQLEEETKKEEIDRRRTLEANLDFSVKIQMLPDNSSFSLSTSVSPSLVFHIVLLSGDNQNCSQGSSNFPEIVVFNVFSPNKVISKEFYKLLAILNFLNLMGHFFLDHRKRKRLRRISFRESIYWPGLEISGILHALVDDDFVEVQVHSMTDDDGIAEIWLVFGANVIMTSESCCNETERYTEALQKLREKFDIVVNIQGDEHLIGAEIIDEVVKALQAGPDAIENASDPNGVKGLAFPPFYFYSRGVKEFLGTIKQHVFLVRSTEDANAFLVNDFQNPLPKTLSSLELPRAVFAAIESSMSMAVGESPSNDSQERTDVEIRSGSSSILHYNMKQRLGIYFSCLLACKVFDKIPYRDFVAWSILRTLRWACRISGHDTLGKKFLVT